MTRYAAVMLAAVLGMVVGYVAGREHLKYEVRSNLLSAADELERGLSAAFGEDSKPGANHKANANGLDTGRKAYITEHMQLYDVFASYMESFIDGRVPGVLFKIRNNGDRSLERVEVTVYFKDRDGRIIAEESYLPVLVSEYSFAGDNVPLRPNYIWQMERGKFYSAKKVPSEWQEGSVEAVITDIHFAGQ